MTYTTKRRTALQHLTAMARRVTSEQGFKENTWYQLNEAGNFIEVK